MFEDATFESYGRIQTRSRRWMILTLILNCSVVVALVLIPLLWPQALPLAIRIMSITAPPPPVAPVPIVDRTAHLEGQSQMHENQIVVPTRIPSTIRIIDHESAPPAINAASMLFVGEGVADAIGNAFHSNTPAHVVADKPTHMRISGPISEGLLLRKTVPVYPPIAIAAHVEGTVVLAATISRDGRIENLQVLSGPAMLRQAAIDAVRTWQYRPFLLSGEPIEVETTVNVIFRRGQ